MDRGWPASSRQKYDIHINDSVSVGFVMLKVENYSLHRTDTSKVFPEHGKAEGGV